MAYSKIDFDTYCNLVEYCHCHESGMTEGSQYKKIKFYGFVRKVRIGGAGTIAFIDIQDGTRLGVINAVYSKKEESEVPVGVYGASGTDEDLVDTSGIAIHDKIIDSCDEDFEIIPFDLVSKKIYRGSSIVVYGSLVKSPEGISQYFDLVIDSLLLIGSVDAEKFSISRTTEKDFLSLRTQLHTRMFSMASQSVFRIRSTLDFMINKFFFDKRIVKTDPNIITINDCEGAGETFQISNPIFEKEDGAYVPVSLTVSSQLPLEATGKGFKRVYTMQKSFRAERSDTSKHLAEFLHVEYEEYFTTLPELLDFTEEYLKTIITDTIENSQDEYKFLDSPFSPKESRGRMKIVLDIISKPFVRITHREAIDLIIKIVKEKIVVKMDGVEKKIKLKTLPTYYDDLSSEFEKILTSFYGTFVFVTHWPSQIKSFYMKQCPPTEIDGIVYQTCESFDLLAPFVGEVFGGSMREYRYDVLDKIIKEREMDVSRLQWFLDLRKEATAPHGGWGMGFARILMLITGVPSVRDVIPYPVYYGHCPY